MASSATTLRPPQPSKIIRDAPFGKRLASACDHHPHCPPLHKGRLRWIVDEFEKRFKETITTETVRKWMHGEARPRDDKAQLLATLLQVDPMWLRHGVDPEMEPRERKARNAMADGAVNIITGLIQMDGGHPAFPVEGDSRENVDLYAIIKGASYAFHVALGEKVGRDTRFVVPTKYDDVLVLGLIRDEMAFAVVELTDDLITEHGTKRGGSIELAVTDGFVRQNRISSFGKRL